jgi:hypothetical protein
MPSQISQFCRKHHAETSLVAQHKAKAVDYSPRKRVPLDKENIRQQAIVSNKKHRRHQRYGIDYDELYDKQGGCCANSGCGRKLAVLDVDHCHSDKHPKGNSDAVRGLLCKVCNVTLGKNNDSVVTLELGIQEAQAKIKVWTGLVEYVKAHDVVFHPADSEVVR